MSYEFKVKDEIAKLFLKAILVEKPVCFSSSIVNWIS
jgi:hypothetical protein